MSSWWSCIVVFALFACAKAPIASVAWEDTPRLPSPTAATYARVEAPPPDAGVQAVLDGRSWDASLGGTAAGLALAVVNQLGSITPPEVREAAWRAGWPYPVSEVRAWSTQAGSPPPGAIATWLAEWPPPASIGLVRARGGLDDVWIGVAARPTVELGSVPRQVPSGGTLAIPALPGVRMRVADPEGTLLEVMLDTTWSSVLEVEGEWLVELDRDGALLARFPVYVGLVPPDLTLLVPTEPPTSAAEADALAVQCLTDVRDAYGLAPFERDPILDAASRTVLATPLLTADELAAHAGIARGDLWRFTCRAATVETCLDGVVWRANARPGLLAQRALLGLTSSVTSSGVELALVVARDAAE